MPVVRPIVFPVALALVLAGCQGSAPDTTPSAVARLGVERLLAARSAAVLAADSPALAATAAPAADPSVAALGSRLTGVPLTTWSYAVQSVVAGPVPGELTVRALLSYRVAADPAGRPAASAVRQLVLGADPGRPGALLVRSDLAVGAGLPWDAGPVAWSAAPGAAVLDLRPAPRDVAALLAGAARASTAVTAVWGRDWRRVPVVVATEGGTQLAQLTGRDPAAVAGLVAVTTADRVYLDMPAWLALPAAGRQVLLTHEVTHLATGAAADPRVPLWLEEGFADYVGFLGSGVRLRTAAAALLDPVSRGGAAPRVLPADAQFDAGGAVAAGAYAGAWLACRVIAAAGGTRTLVAVYRATAAGRADPAGDADAGLRSVTGIGTSGWTARWRAYVEATA